MSLTFLQVKQKLQPFVLRMIGSETTEWIFDDELVDACNQVAGDLNVAANIHTERYYYKTTANQNNYELDGDIIHINQLKYQDTDWRDQHFAIVQTSGTPFLSTIVFETTPTSSEIQLDIYYLRKVLDIEDSDTDEIDLPAVVESDFLSLMRSKLETIYGNKGEMDYQMALERIKRQVYPRIKRVEPAGGGTKRHWCTLDSTDDSYYDIKDNEVSADQVQVNADGTYTWLEV